MPRSGPGSRSAALLALLACGCAAPDRTPAADPAASEPPAAAPAASSGWTVTPAGAGPARVGMTLAELAPLLETGTDTAALSDGCGYVRVAGAPDSVAFMVEGRRLVRIDVLGGPTATAEGARVGDTEDRIRSLYPGSRQGPQKYTSGHSLTALRGAPGDTLHRYVFETDGERVTNFRAGLLPAVEYVERCG